MRVSNRMQLADEKFVRMTKQGPKLRSEKITVVEMDAGSMLIIYLSKYRC